MTHGLSYRTGSRRCSISTNFWDATEMNVGEPVDFGRNLSWLHTEALLKCSEKGFAELLWQRLSHSKQSKH